MSKVTTRSKPRTKRSSKKADAPWEHEPTHPKKPQHLTSTQRAAAKRRAKAAGRRYPNLVDNMHEASTATKNDTPKKTSSKKTSSKKTSSKKTSSKKTSSKKTKPTSARKAISGVERIGADGPTYEWARARSHGASRAIPLSGP